jgi:hypothetical protein
MLAYDIKVAPPMFCRAANMTLRSVTIEAKTSAEAFVSANTSKLGPIAPARAIGRKLSLDVRPNIPTLHLNKLVYYLGIRGAPGGREPNKASGGSIAP